MMILRKDRNRLSLLLLCPGTVKLGQMGRTGRGHKTVRLGVSLDFSSRHW